MDLFSFILGFGSLCVAALSLFITYKSRSNKLREMLFQKQYDVISEIIILLHNYYTQIQNFIVSKGFRLNKQTRPELRLSTKESRIELQQILHRTNVFLLNDILRSISNFLWHVDAISPIEDFESQYPSEIVNSKDPGLLISKEFKKVNDSIRRYIGVEQLSKENLNIIEYKK
ncbi:MAG: hypothetical protein JXA92_06510 [candidate division Zixibacteria bacterium]|nr:hypothetical protein [candidate division Zixibacteria bacterium]